MIISANSCESARKSKKSGRISLEAAIVSVYSGVILALRTDSNSFKEFFVRDHKVLQLDKFIDRFKPPHFHSSIHADCVTCSIQKLS